MRWITRNEDQGQMIEVSYAHPEDDLEVIFLRLHDRADQTIEYFVGQLADDCEGITSPTDDKPTIVGQWRQMGKEKRQDYDVTILALGSSLGSLGLTEEIEASDETPIKARATICDANGYLQSGEAIEVAFFENAGRAGISWGADPVWTDANSVEDALDRFFENDGKYICN